MMMYDVMINDLKLCDKHLLVVKRPDIPAPVEKIVKVSRPNNDGDLYIDSGNYEDITISIEFNYMGSSDDWHSIWREAKKILLQSAGKNLTLSDDFDFYFRIKKVDIGTNARVSFKIGKFTASFICDPYSYLKKGAFPHEVEQCLYNPYGSNRPIYKIDGEGVCVVIVNGKQIKANIAQNLTIDTYKRVAYREDGTLSNTSFNGDIEDMVLKEGMNEISITPGFVLKIIPNWRYI